MRRFAPTLLCLIVLTASCAPRNPPQVLRVPDIPRKAILKAFTAHQGSIGRATGFLIRHKNRMFVITAGHVACGSNLIWFQTPGGQTSPIAVDGVICPDFHDVVILFVSNVPKNHPYLELDAKMSVELDDTCYSYGYSNGDELTSRRGKIKGSAALAVCGKMRVYLATSSYLEPGMSGGPVIAGNKVIGVNSCFFAKTLEATERTGVHVPACELAKYLDMMIEKCSTKR